MGLTSGSFDVRGGVFPGSKDFNDCVAAITYPGSSSKSYFFWERNSQLEM